MRVLQTPSFVRTAKKLHKNQKRDLDEAVRQLSANPSLGQQKKGVLNGVRVFKFKMVKQLTLLAYQLNEETLVFLALGSHENFYRDLESQTS